MGMRISTQLFCQDLLFALLTCLKTGFGSALNIETLVAAAERRETPIQVQILIFCNSVR